MNIRGIQSHIQNLAVGEVGTLAVEQTHHVRLVLHRAERTCDVILHKRLLYNRVALIGLYLLQQRCFVEGTIDRGHNRERLSTVKQVGIADRCLLMHTEHLRLLENLAEIAQLRVCLHLLPERQVATHSISVALVVVIPLGTAGGDCGSAAAQQTGYHILFDSFSNHNY